MLPIGIVLELLLLGLFFIWKGKPKKSLIFLFSAMLVLWVSSMPVIADALFGKLEQQYPAIALENIPASECIVVLGGAVGPVLTPRIYVEFFDASDRVHKAASLYLAGKGRVIIVAGGNQPWSPFEQSEAQAIQSVLVGWGVPASAVLLDGASRNTRENATNARVLLEKSNCDTPLLVTSAAHMARSVATFASVGVEVFPVSTDIRVVKSPKLAPIDFLPDAAALKMTSDAMREWIGQQVYRIQGWN